MLIVCALAFFTFAMVFALIAGFLLLRELVGPIEAALYVSAASLLCASIFVFAAFRKKHDARRAQAPEPLRCGQRQNAPQGDDVSPQALIAAFAVGFCQGEK
ncbi:MAG: hypothetical protein AAF744_06795 [Pseudomonadota bacterium]